MSPSSIYSKTGKGVQEASGKTTQLSRGDRAILAAIDGRLTLKELSAKFDRAPDERFFALIRKMDQDGFIREVSPGTVQRGAANAPRPSTPSKPRSPDVTGADLDFTQIFSAPPKLDKPPSVPTDPMAAARQEAELRARAAREAKARADAEAKARFGAEQRDRLEAEARAKAAREAAMQAAAEGKTKVELEAQRRAEEAAKAREAAVAIAREEAVKLRAEAAEREAREKEMDAERLRFEAAERARREAEELRRKLEDERRAREEAERRAREEAERTRRAAEERARREEEERKARAEAEALRQKLEEERKAREEAERKAEEERRAREEQERREQEEFQRQLRLAREAEDKKRRDADARKRKEEEAKRWEVEEARRRSDDAYRQRAEEEDRLRAEREAVEAAERAEAEKKAHEAMDALAGSLAEDLESFSRRQEEERRQQEEEESRARAETERRLKEEEEQRAREEAERKARKAEEKRLRDEEERRQAEEIARLAREAEDRRKREEEEAERKRKERETARRAEAVISPEVGAGEVQEDDRRMAPEARKALRARQREVARARGRGDQPAAKAAAAYKRKQPVRWGRGLAVVLFAGLVIGALAVNFLPLPTAEYEKAASEALGAPVKIRAARMWLLTGLEVRLERVSVGESVKIAEVRAVPEFGSLLGEDRAFSRVQLDGLVMQQSALGGALLGAMQGRRLRVARVTAENVKLEGPVDLPAVSFDAAVGRDSRIASVRLMGEALKGTLTPKAGAIGFNVELSTFAVPFLGKLPITEFGAKGSADRQGMVIQAFDGRLYEGTVVGNARIQWGAQWSVQGEVEGRTMNAAVFSPLLVPQGRFDGRGRFAMAGPDLARLHESARLEGTFTVTKGVLGSFDLSRALQSTAAQLSGRTPFSELHGNVSLAGGAFAFRDLRLSSGLLGATGALDVDAKGRLSGRVNAELRNLHGTFYIGGSLTEPQLRR
jgi:hypothetical protein